jgi:hypothetical protein
VEPYTEPLKSPALDDAPESEVGRDQEDTCRVRNGPRIRLRVSHPRITLRLKLQDTSQPGKKKKVGTKREKKKKGTKREKGKKGKRQNETDALNATIDRLECAIVLLLVL